MTLRRTPLEVATPELRVVLACRDRPCVGTDAAMDSECGWVGEEVDDHRPGEVS